MLSAVAITVGVAGLLAGAIGSWSPCGFSMVATLSAGARGSRARLGWACAAFSAGAGLGALTSFEAFSGIGLLVRGAAGGGGAVTVAIAVAGAGAVMEARRMPIRPQVRRQVPEPWRRVLPLPLACALYGVLLGLGFTTFVMSWVYWALAGVCVALANPALGLAAGIGFGLGRALPILGLAPVAERSCGLRLLELMGERPAVLACARLGGAVALSLVAVALAVAGAPAQAAVATRGRRAAAPSPPTTPVASPATDPSVDQGDLAWQAPGANGVLLHAGQQIALPGTNPALGGPYVAVRNGDAVMLLDRFTLKPVQTVPAPGADALAVSATWLVYRRLTPAGDELHAVPLPAGAPDRVVASSQGVIELGRPALAASSVVYDRAGPDASSLEAVDLVSGAVQVLRHSKHLAFVNPAVLGNELLYERMSYCAQEVHLTSLNGRGGGGDRVVMFVGAPAARDRGLEPGVIREGARPSRCPARFGGRAAVALWATALSPTAAYVTELGPPGTSGARAQLVSVPL